MIQTKATTTKAMSKEENQQNVDIFTMTNMQNFNLA